jgi:hypothetical protein
MYSAVSGYNPTDPSTDVGATLQDALDFWRKNGLAGNRIAAFAFIDAQDVDLVRACIATFGAVYTGMNFPSSAMDQINRGEPWTVVRRSRIEGGHCVPIGAYDADSFTCVTWGQTQRMDARSPTSPRPPRPSRLRPRSRRLPTTARPASSPRCWPRSTPTARRDLPGGGCPARRRRRDRLPRATAPLTFRSPTTAALVPASAGRGRHLCVPGPFASRRRVAARPICRLAGRREPRNPTRRDVQPWSAAGLLDEAIVVGAG